MSIDLGELYVDLEILGVEFAGAAPVTGATKSQVQQSAFNFADAGGANNAFTVTLSPAPASLTDGLLVTMYSGSLFNTTTNPTLNVNGLGAKPIEAWFGSVAAGDIQTGIEYFFIYNATLGVFQLINPSISTADTFQVQANGYNYALDTGTANAYIANISPALAGIVAGQSIIMLAINNNTGDSTLTVNGHTAHIQVSSAPGTELQGGEIIAGIVYEFLWNASYDVWDLINSSLNKLSPSSSDANFTATGSAINYPIVYWQYSSSNILGTFYQNLLAGQIASTSLIGPTTINFNNLAVSFSGLVVSWSSTTSIISNLLLAMFGQISLTTPLLTTFQMNDLIYVQGILLSNINSLSSFSLPALQVDTGALTVTSATSLTTLSLPVLTSILGAFSVTANSLTTLTLTDLQNVNGAYAITANVLTSLSLPALTNIGGAFTSTLESLTSLSMPSLTTVTGSFYPTADSLTSMSLPALATISGALTPVGAALATLSMPSLTTISLSFSPTLPMLTTLTLTNLATIGGAFSPVFADLVSLSLPALTSVGGLFSPNMASCTSVSLPLLTTINSNFTLNNSLISSVSAPSLISISTLSLTLPALTSLTLTNLTSMTGGCVCIMASLTTFSLPAVVTCGALLNITGASLTTISMPSLTNAAGTTFTTGALTSLTLTNLATVGANISWTVGGLTSLSLPALTSVGGAFGFSAPSCTSFSCPSLLTIGGAIGGGITLNANSYVTIAMGALTSIGTTLYISSTALTTLTLTSLQTTGGATTIIASSLTSVALPALVSSPGLTITCAAATTLTLTALQTVTGAATWQLNALVSLSLPALLTITSTFIIVAANMTTFSFNSGLLRIGGNVTMTGMKLTQASVDGILVSLANLNGTGGTTAYSSLTVNLSGGTSSTPSATGLAAKATLVGRGCTVTTN